MPRYRYKRRDCNVYLVVWFDGDPPDVYDDNYVLVGGAADHDPKVPRRKVTASWDDVDKHMKHCEVTAKENERKRMKHLTEFFADHL